jgi:uncharacterized cupredoxin-like copper-binding protein
MKNLVALVAAVSAFGLAAGAWAAGDLSAQNPIVVRVDLGKAGTQEHRFHPGTLQFETGKLYRLVIHNPSNDKHYFTSYGLAEKVFTRKAQVMDDVGTGAKAIAEIKGAIREIEVMPGGTAEWWFVPVAAGTLTDLHCHIKDQDGKTHAEKGMKGVIEIK